PPQARRRFAAVGIAVRLWLMRVFGLNRIRTRRLAARRAIRWLPRRANTLGRTPQDAAACGVVRSWTWSSGTRAILVAGILPAPTRATGPGSLGHRLAPSP